MVDDCVCKNFPADFLKGNRWHVTGFSISFRMWIFLVEKQGGLEVVGRCSHKGVTAVFAMVAGQYRLLEVVSRVICSEGLNSRKCSLRALRPFHLLCDHALTG